MVNLEWYRSFVATYQTGTVTAAAQQRYLTQPTLSQHIAALEQALKTSLFARTARRMVPTDAAQKLYSKVIASIERLEAIEHTPLEHVATPWLRLGAPATYCQAHVLRPAIIHGLGKVRLDVTLGETPALIEQLKNNNLDLVIATQKLNLPRLHYIYLQQEQFVLVLPKSLPLAVSDKNDPQQVEAWLSQQRWISYSAQMPIIRRYWQTVFKKRPEFEPAMLIPDLHAILRCIEREMGVSILPDYLLKQSDGEAAVQTPWQPEVAISNSLYLVCQQDRLREPLIEQAINILQQELNKNPV